jgi:hypothetical protein
MTIGKNKCKINVSVQAMKTYGEAEVELHSFSTLAIDGMSAQIHATASFPPGEKFPVPMKQDVGCAPDLLRTLWMREQCLDVAGNRTTIHWLSSP